MTTVYEVVLSMLYCMIGLSFANPTLVMVGNSYIQSNALPEIVEDRLDSFTGWESTTTSSLTGGGLTLADHLIRMTDPNSTWGRTFAESHDWFLFQDQSQIPGFPQAESYWQDSLEGLTQMHAQVDSLGGQSMLMLTWGRRDGDSQNPILFSDFETMQERLNNGYLAYASQASTQSNRIFVAPVGPVFHKIYQVDRAVFFDLYSNDGSHPSELGSQLAALSISSSLTGRSVGDLELDLPPEMEQLFKSSVDSVVLEESVGLFPMPWEWSQIPVDGRIEDSRVRPLLRVRADQSIDLDVVDGRLWLENGRLTGTVTVSEISKFTIDGGVQLGSVNGDVSIVDGRLRLSVVTGSVLQSGGEVQLDQESVNIGEEAVLTYVTLHPDLNEARLTAGQLNVDRLTVADGLNWETVDNTLVVFRTDAEPEVPADTGEVFVEQDAPSKTGCASAMGLIWLLPFFGRRR